MRYTNESDNPARSKPDHLNQSLCLFDFRSILEKIHARYADQAYTKGLEFFIDFDKKLPDNLISEPNKIEQIFTSLTLHTLEAINNGYIKIKVCLNMTDYDSMELKCLIEGRCAEQTQAYHTKESVPPIISNLIQPSIIKILIESLGGKLYSPRQENGNITFWFTLKCDYSDQEPNYFGSNLINQTLYFVDTCSQSKEIYIKLFDSMGFQVVDATNPDKIIESSNKKDIFVYSIDAHYPSTMDFCKLLDAYKNKKIRKFAFISSYNREFHELLIDSGFDNVIPKTINRKQLVNYFSTASNSMTSQQTRDTPSKHKNQLPRVLVVDDNEINVKILEAYLKPLNVETITATNGESALQKLEEHSVDLVFMDLHMPIMNGYQTTEAIRMLGGMNATIPIIGITADGLQESIQKCLQSGMNQCLVKPVIHTDIEEILQTWVFQHRLIPVQIPNDLDDLVKMMIDELPNYKTQLKNAIKKNDHEHVYQIAHRITGGCAYCNMPTLRKASLQLQTATKSRNKIFIEKSVEQLLRTIDALIEKPIN